MLIRKFFVVLVFFTCIKTFAGNDGYFTTYNHHIEAGEWELMLMNDYTVPSSLNRAEGEGHYFSQMVEIEYEVANRFATEFMIEGFEDLESGKSMFTGFRWENRFKLFKEENLFNPLVYVAYEHLQKETRYKMEASGWVNPPYETAKEEEKDERILETRLILSHDFTNTNIAFNWINETDLRNGNTDFGYSFGFLHFIGKGHEHHHGGQGHFISLSAIGFELYGGVGDSKVLSIRPSGQQHYIQPLLVFHLSSGLMVHTGFAWGLTDSSDRFIGRIAIGIEF